MKHSRNGSLYHKEGISKKIKKLIYLREVSRILWIEHLKERGNHIDKNMKKDKY